MRSTIARTAASHGPDLGSYEGAAASSGAGAPRQGTGDSAQQVTASIAQATQALGEIAKALQGNQVRISVATHAGYPDADQAKKLTGSRGTRPATRKRRAIRRWTRRSAFAR